MAPSLNKPLLALLPVLAGCAAPSIHGAVPLDTGDTAVVEKQIQAIRDGTAGKLTLLEKACEIDAEDEDTADLEGEGAADAEDEDVVDGGQEDVMPLCESENLEEMVELIERAPDGLEAMLDDGRIVKMPRSWLVNSAYSERTKKAAAFASYGDSASQDDNWIVLIEEDCPQEDEETEEIEDPDECFGGNDPRVHFDQDTLNHEFGHGWLGIGHDEHLEDLFFGDIPADAPNTPSNRFARALGIYEGEEDEEGGDISTYDPVYVLGYVNTMGESVRPVVLPHEEWRFSWYSGRGEDLRENWGERKWHCEVRQSLQRTANKGPTSWRYDVTDELTPNIGDSIVDPIAGGLGGVLGFTARSLRDTLDTDEGLAIHGSIVDDAEEEIRQMVEVHEDWIDTYSLYECMGEEVDESPEKDEAQDDSFIRALPL